MLEWRLDVMDVVAALGSCETIEEYEDGARLVLGRSDVRPLHLVVRVGDDDGTNESTLFVITVYEPDPLRWDPSFRRRIGSWSVPCVVMASCSPAYRTRPSPWMA
jgi:hypothetical protein